ncbi:MAG: cysteine desulfurase family protein, partial [Planctomycetota bacterium]
DNNATTRPDDSVVAAMGAVSHEAWGNPSSVHRFGQEARRRVDLARASVCRLVGCRDRDLVVTSGGTESANLAIRGSLAAQPDRRTVVTTRIEHSAVRELAESLGRDGIDVRWVDPDGQGRVHVGQLEEILDACAESIAVVSVIWVNNETGVVQPIEAIGDLCRSRGVRFHTDATQRVGRQPVDMASLPVDMLSFAAHKFHGPKGVGGLALAPRVRLRAQIIGGPQERDRRGGTENAAGIVGMGVAADRAVEWIATDGAAKQAALRDRFERAVVERCDGAVVMGEGAERSWTTANIAFPRLEAEAVLLLLSERGVCASAGAACSSGSLDPSPVILAMGIPDDVAHGAVRFSLSRETTSAEIDEAIEIVAEVEHRLRASFAGS